MPYSPLGGYVPMTPQGAPMQAAAMGVQNPALQQAMAQQMAGRPMAPPQIPTAGPQPMPQGAPPMPPQGGPAQMPPSPPWMQQMIQHGPQGMGIGSLQPRHMAMGGMVAPMQSSMHVPSVHAGGGDALLDMYRTARLLHGLRQQ